MNLREFLSPDADTSRFIALMCVTSAIGVAGALRYTLTFNDGIQTAERDYRKNESHCALDAPDEHLRRALRPERVTRILGPIPSVLVTLGILGTFLGIGLAVAKAIPALRAGSEPQQVRDALRGLLEAVKFKFQTSAWGILFSLGFLGLSTWFEAWIHRQIAASAARLTPARRSLGGELGGQMERVLRDELARGFGRIDDSLQSTLKALSSSATELGQGVGKLAGILDPFRQQILSATDAIQASSNKLGNLGRDIEVSLAKISTTLTNAGRAQQEALSMSLGDLTRTLERSTRDQQEALKSSLAGVSRTLQDAVGELRKALDEQHNISKQMAQQQAKAASDLRDGMQQSLQRMEGSLRDLGQMQASGMQKLVEQQASAADSLEGLRVTLGRFQTDLSRLLELIEQFQAQVAVRPPVPSFGSHSHDPSGAGGGDDHGNGF
jgi:hypothetical protein